jgi:uncharacterized protein YwgA
MEWLGFRSSKFATKKDVEDIVRKIDRLEKRLDVFEETIKKESKRKVEDEKKENVRAEIREYK